MSSIIAPRAVGLTSTECSLDQQDAHFAEGTLGERAESSIGRQQGSAGRARNTECDARLTLSQQDSAGADIPVTHPSLRRCTLAGQEESKMGLHRIGDSWFSSEEFSQIRERECRSGLAGIGAIIGAFTGPWLAGKLGIAGAGGFPFLLGIICGALVGYTVGHVILFLGLVAFVVWLAWP
jgi:hypothetical protein